MEYFVDSEFVDDGRTIDLISIGIVSGDGREYYAQSCEFNAAHSSGWVWDNVFPHLKMCYGSSTWKATTITDSQFVHRQQGKCDLYTIHNLPDECPWRTRMQIRSEIIAFCDPEQYGKPEFIGWCCSYDHVAFCQLFGTMIMLPVGYPHYFKDLQNALDERGIPDHDLPVQEGTTHNALSDARYIKLVWEAIVNPLYRSEWSMKERHNSVA